MYNVIIYIFTSQFSNCQNTGSICKLEARLLHVMRETQQNRTGLCKVDPVVRWWRCVRKPPTDTDRRDSCFIELSKAADRWRCLAVIADGRRQLFLRRPVVTSLSVGRVCVLFCNSHHLNTHSSSSAIMSPIASNSFTANINKHAVYSIMQDSTGRDS